MSTDLLINPITEDKLNKFIAEPSHALLLSGDRGSGLDEISKMIASEVLNSKLKIFVNFYPIKPTKSTISIEQIRDLKSNLKLSTTNSGNIKRVIVIQDAHLMTDEAQNALLKVIEEPTEGNIFILTATHANLLLDTIISRCQSIGVSPLSFEQVSTQYLGNGYTNTDIKRAYIVSCGHSKLLDDIIKKNESNLLEEISRVKDVLKSSKFERLIYAGQLKSKEDSIKQIEILIVLAKSGIRNSTDPLRWARVLDVCYDSYELLLSNSSPKAVMSNLLISV